MLNLNIWPGIHVKLGEYLSAAFLKCFVGLTCKFAFLHRFNLYARKYLTQCCVCEMLKRLFNAFVHSFKKAECNNSSSIK